MKYSRPTSAMCAYFDTSTICEENYVKDVFLFVYFSTRRVS